MKLSKVRCIKSPLMILLLITIIFLMPVYALATMYQYTYTSGDFTNIYGTEWTTSDHLILSFTFDPGTAAGSASEVFPFTMSAGSWSTNSADAVHLSEPELDINWDSAGNITTWSAVDEEVVSNLDLLFSSYSGNNYGLLRDQSGAWIAFAQVTTPGSWSKTEVTTPPTGVPEPSTMLLLGSGLAGLVAFRKRFKEA